MVQLAISEARVAMSLIMRFYAFMGYGRAPLAVESQTGSTQAKEESSRLPKFPRDDREASG
jgi:hypothetical protein